ncbi:MAG: 4-hydroxy-tetrahydrodipicolinate synthase [Candidatus Omnitrophica bacterium]|nr:4-hydroxy-tetrahydrodipicolinate synthase [Candidatus Omnitrophota bacterium]MBU1524670.1 4-hydroxy-tetrahydrodipicolinate synthase [Candidatus Omnitrophota bacterium]MBU2436145.1 4-hydroxy-tetrahydrodipicolinate synthase [Candidatus Omnitrophota bacterium]
MLKGSIVALVTPFSAQGEISLQSGGNENGEINEERFRFLINWHIENKTDGVLICGTTGESATLSHPEHKKLMEIAVDEANKRIPIIAGCGSNSTKEALDLTEHAKKVGADYALVITPYYNKPTQEGLYQHYKKITSSVNIPVIIYNVPSRTGSNILPETVARVYKDCKNIVGIKEASGSLDQITELMTKVDSDFLLFSGSDEVTLPILSVGGVGVISVVANIAPKETHNLVASFLDGNLKEAKKMQLYLYDLIKALFIETNPIPTKTALSLMGLIEFNLRLPLYKMSEDNLEKLKKILKGYKLI